jgi:hypothetical protein
VQCPSPVGAVRDLRRNSLVIAGGRPRTKANETEIETTRGSPRGNRSAARSISDEGTLAGCRQRGSVAVVSAPIQRRVSNLGGWRRRWLGCIDLQLHAVMGGDPDSIRGRRPSRVRGLRSRRSTGPVHDHRQIVLVAEPGHRTGGQRQQSTGLRVQPEPAGCQHPQIVPMAHERDIPSRA